MYGKVPKENPTSTGNIGVFGLRHGHPFDALNCLLECVEEPSGELLAQHGRFDGAIVTDGFAKVRPCLRKDLAWHRSEVELFAKRAFNFFHR